MARYGPTCQLRKSSLGIKAGYLLAKMWTCHRSGSSGSRRTSGCWGKSAKLQNGQSSWYLGTVGGLGRCVAKLWGRLERPVAMTVHFSVIISCRNSPVSVATFAGTLSLFFIALLTALFL